MLLLTEPGLTIVIPRAAIGDAAAQALLIADVQQTIASASPVGDRA